MKYVSFYGLLLVVLLSSCVSKKQLTYLQNKEESTNSEEFRKIDRGEYRVQINDILNIRVLSYEEDASATFNVNSPNAGNNLVGGDLIFYLNGYTVDEEGKVELPGLEKVKVSGYTVNEIRDTLQIRLEEFLKENTFFVSVQLSGIRFSVVGEVRQPGKFTIYQNQLNIFEALALAGDITTVGNRTAVQIVRQYPEGIKIHSIDLTDQEVIHSPYFFLQPNDVVNVQPLRVKSFGTGRTGFESFTAFTVVLSAVSSVLLINNLLK